jgi:hypothetical protein
MRIGHSFEEAMKHLAMEHLLDKTNGAIGALIRFVTIALRDGMEVKRIALPYLAMQLCGLPLSGKMFEDIADSIAKKQQADGGWNDIEETVLATKYFSLLCSTKFADSIDRAEKFLLLNRNMDGAWGRSQRDISRIPITALLMYFMPKLRDHLSGQWIENAWRKDLNAATNLTYKGAFFLLACDAYRTTSAKELAIDTCIYLSRAQNDDGGFGPWKNHPIGSDPWSTGVVLWGLSKWIDRVDPVVIERALHWLEVTQLPSGYWPYHYLDEGTSYALIGAVSAMRAMASRK